MDNAQPRAHGSSDAGRYSLSRRPSFEVVAALAGLCFILLLSFLAVQRLNPPAAADANAPLTEFSAARAMVHVTSISASPRPIGSSAHAATRDYIIGQLEQAGLHPEVQKTTAVNTRWGSPFRAAAVENIVARLQGTSNAKAVLLAGHYDSVPNSFGASDDGAAVAALLESLRALRAGDSLKNDVIFLFTDGEEVGLLGAKAFVEEHPWAKDVGVVLNFEARGNSGPSIMFETSDGNAWVVEQFARATRHPVANSLSYDIYKFLPNDTDFTVFKNGGLSGLNFAYIQGLTHYHSSLDNAENVDPRSLQHHGQQALALARHFGNLNFDGAGGGNLVYFDFLGWALVRYSTPAALALVVLTALLTLGLTATGIRKGVLTFYGIVAGFLGLLVSMIVAAVFVWLLKLVADAILSRLGAPPVGVGDNEHLYVAAFIALAVSSTVAVYAVLRKRVAVENLAAGARLWFLLLMVLSILFLPGGSYLLTWPLLFSLLALGYQLFMPEGARTRGKLFVVLFLCATPPIVLFAPMIFQVFVALGAGPGWLVAALLTVLLLGLLVEHLSLVVAATKWLLPLGGALAAACLILVALYGVKHDRNHPRTDNVVYILNADTRRAVWTSDDNGTDEWTAQFFQGDASKGTLGDFLPQAGDGQFLQRQAPLASLAAPEVELLGDGVDGGERITHLHVTSPRHAELISVYADAEVSGGEVGGKRVGGGASDARLAPAGNWALNYWAPPAEGIELTLRTKPSEPLKIRVVDQSYGLPEGPGMTVSGRPPDIIPKPFSGSDATLISRSFSFAPPASGGMSGRQ